MRRGHSGKKVRNGAGGGPVFVSQAGLCATRIRFLLATGRILSRPSLAPPGAVPAPFAGWRQRASGQSRDQAGRPALPSWGMTLGAPRLSLWQGCPPRGRRVAPVSRRGGLDETIGETPVAALTTHGAGLVSELSGSWSL